MNYESNWNDVKVFTAAGVGTFKGNCIGLASGNSFCIRSFFQSLY